MALKRKKIPSTNTSHNKKKSITDFDLLIAVGDFEGVRDGAIPFIDALLKKISVKRRVQVRRRLLNARYRAIILYGKNKADRSRDGNFLLYYSTCARDVLEVVHD